MLYFKWQKDPHLPDFQAQVLSAAQASLLCLDDSQYVLDKLAGIFIFLGLLSHLLFPITELHQS